MFLSKSTFKLIILSLLVLFSGFATAADSNKEKLKQMLDGAQKPQATSDIPDHILTGHWIGVYDYNNRTADTPAANTFTMVVEKSPEGIVGIILEPDLNPQYYAQIAEVVNPRVNGSTFSFTKKYNSGTTIEYSLEVNSSNRVMAGSWNIKNGPSGVVNMVKFEAKDLQ